MAEVYQNHKIPYRVLHDLLFDESGRQQVVPFLGAGVSLAALPVSTDVKPEIVFPDPAKVEKAADELNLTGRARNLFHCAVALSSLVAASDTDDPGDGQTFLTRLQTNEYPPSVNDLVSAIADLAQFDVLEQAASDLTKRWPKQWKVPELNDLSGALKAFVQQAGLVSGLSPLTSVSGYFETKQGREILWKYLFQIFKNKKTPTSTHRLLAAAAGNYLATQDFSRSYVIVTANYDCLMEQALDESHIPYVVLTLRKGDGRICARFCDSLKKYE